MSIQPLTEKPVRQAAVHMDHLSRGPGQALGTEQEEGLPFHFYLSIDLFLP